MFSFVDRSGHSTPDILLQQFIDFLHNLFYKSADALFGTLGYLVLECQNGRGEPQIWLHIL